MAGACTPAPDTLDDLGSDGSGTGGTGGSGGSVAPNQGKEFFAAREGDLYKACGSCHDAGGIADTPFLAGPDLYATIVSWPGIIVQDAKESTRLTYPSAGPQHPYKKLDAAEYKETLFPAVDLVHPLFSVLPLGKDSDPDPVDSLSNIDQSFDSGQAGALGPGKLILTNWRSGAKLTVAFEKIEPFTTQVGDGGADGGTNGGCKDVTSFNANAAKLLEQSCQGCHGGANGQAKRALDMTALTSDPAAACSQVKNRINPANVGSSQLFITTDPGGNAAHPFKFGGNNANFDAFKQSVSLWISAEK